MDRQTDRQIETEREGLIETNRKREIFSEHVSASVEQRNTHANTDIYTHRANTFGKGLNLTILPSAMGK